MQLGEIIQRVQSLYSKGVQSDDSRLTPRHTYSAITSARNTILRQRINKKQFISDWSFQTLPCVELIKAPLTKCPCVPNEGCLILRTKHKLPKPITGLESHMIRNITNMDGSMGFDPTTFDEAKYNVGNKYTSKKPLYYPRNGYLYLTVMKHMKVIPITGLFDDFVAAQTFPSYCPCEDCECQDIMLMEFPLEGDAIKTLLEIANQELIILMKQMEEDKLSDSQDNDKATGMVHQPQPQQYE